MKTVKMGALFVCMVLCAGLAFAKGEKIEAGSPQDPFAGTSWISKGIEFLDFKDDGKVDYGFNTYSYTVEKNGESYTALFKAAGVKFQVNLESKDATEISCKSGPAQFSAQKK